jgi:hypothetical protein
MIAATNSQNLQGLDQKAFDYAVQAFEASNTYFEGSIQPQIDNDLRQFYGLHPAGSKYYSADYAARSKLFRPKTRAAIQSGLATGAEALFTTEDVVSYEPENSDDLEHVACAEIWQTVMQNRLTKPAPVGMPWFVTALGAYQDAMATGVCCSYNFWDYDKKRGFDRPNIQLRPIENIRFDPGAQWYDPVGTSPYLIDMIPMYVGEVKRRMKDKTKSGEPLWLPMTDTQLQQAATAYTNSTRYVREHKRQDSKDSGQTLTDFSIVWVHRVLMEINGDQHCYYTLGTSGLLAKPLPLEKCYWHGIRPYTMGFCVLETHKVYPSGIPRLTKDLQAEANETANSRIDNVKLAMQKRWLVKRNRNVDIASLRRSVPNSVTMVNDLEDVEPLEFNDVTASSYQEQDRINVDFDEMAGTFSNSSVQSNRKLNETVGGMNLFSNSANKLSNLQLRMWIETWLEPTLAQVQALEREYEDDQGLFLLAARQSPAMQKLNPDALTEELISKPLTVRVNVGGSSTDPVQKVSMFMFALAKMKEAFADGVLQSNGANVDEIQKEIFGKLGYKAGRRFFNREQDPRIAELEAQVQELSQQLAAKKEDPALTQAKIDKLNAETQQILQTIQMQETEGGISAEEAAAMRAEMEALTKEHEQTVSDYQQQIAAMEFESNERADEARQTDATRRYEIDRKAEIAAAKVKSDNDTKLSIAKMQSQRDQKLDGVMARMKKLGESVKGKAKPKATA